MADCVLRFVGPHYGDPAEIVRLMARSFGSPQELHTLCEPDAMLQTRIVYRQQQLVVSSIVQQALRPTSAYAVLLSHPGALIFVVSASQGVWDRNVAEYQYLQRAAAQRNTTFVPDVVLLNDRWAPDVTIEPIAPTAIRPWFPAETPILSTTIGKRSPQVVPLLDTLLCYLFS